jgi:hypothetical protein
LFEISAGTGPGKMANKKSDVARTKELLLKQRDQYFDQYEDEPEVEQRKNNSQPRSISDRRSSIAPNQTDYSRRQILKDRRQTKFGRRKTDLSVKSKLLE